MSQTITITVSDEDAARVAVACAALHPIPKIPDPEWVQPENDPNAKPPLIAEYSGADWPAAYYKSVVEKDVIRYEKMIAAIGLEEPTITIT
jgi:hypothetical protein